jgi:DNA ligase 1
VKPYKSTKVIKQSKPINETEIVKSNKSNILYDVKKQGVMLAHTFKDPKTGKIKSAPKGSTQAPNGWYLSEKIDGYRAIWNGEDFVSRNGNIFPAPPDFKKWLPKNEALDGELFMGRENFEKCGLFRKKEADCEAWKKANVTYQIFDSPTMSGMFEERTSKIEKLIKEQCKKYSGKCPLIMTKQIKVNDEEDVYKHFNKLVSKGAEGVMLRAPNSPYDKKRSNYLLKVKQLFDAECKIIGYKKGSGKYANMLGAFECELVKNKSIKFTISGMDDTIRSNYNKTHPLGTIVTFTYMGLTEKGVPRHPNYLRKRGTK